MPRPLEIYELTFNDDQTEVTGLAVVLGARGKGRGHGLEIDVSRVDFSFTPDDDGRVSDVLATRADRHGWIEAVNFSDADSDGLYAIVRSGRLATEDADHLRQRAFVIADDGSVHKPASANPSRHGRDHDDHDDDGDGDDDLTPQAPTDGSGIGVGDELRGHIATTLDGVDYVVAYKARPFWAGAEIYRDDNGDGTWTRVAVFDGPELFDWVQDDGSVDLTGVAGLLALTDGLTG